MARCERDLRNFGGCAGTPPYHTSTLLRSTLLRSPSLNCAAEGCQVQCPSRRLLLPRPWFGIIRDSNGSCGKVECLRYGLDLTKERKRQEEMGAWRGWVVMKTKEPAQPGQAQNSPIECGSSRWPLIYLVVAVSTSPQTPCPQSAVVQVHSRSGWLGYSRA